jgi:hemolysin D
MGISILKFERPSTEQLFLPAVIEVEATPPSPIGRGVLWTLIALVGFAFLWALFGHVDVVAVAPGKLVPTGQVKVLQSPNSGTVKAIHVTDGERVVAGQVLIELDPTLSQADAERVAGELETAKQELARQQAFVEGIDSRSGGSDFASLAPSQKSALEGALVAHRSRVRQIDLAIERRRAELQATQEQVAKLERTLPLVSERADAVTRLATTGLVARHAALEIEQERITTEQDLATARANLTATKAAIAELGEERSSTQAEAARATLERMAELEARISMLTQERVKTERLATETVLRAPVAGEIQQLALHTVGGVAKAGETLLVIVPEGPALEVEALVLNKDMGFVREGQLAAVKLDAFPFTRYGSLEGQVVAVGEDSVPHEQLGSVYPVRVRVLHNDIRVDGRTVRLSSGMAASVEVRTGARRILDFLLSPVAKAADESLRER